ncbi:MAG: hypothetical protein JWO33_2935 [Caulobacteraceae bacterium]|nr:hypothetical protein [Caulobacteraceae bacterium]
MNRRSFVTALVLAAMAGAAAASEKPEAGKTTNRFLQVGGMSATVLKRGGRRGVLTTDCGLDIPDEVLRERATASLPRLRAAYVQAIQTYATGLSPAEPPDPDQLSKILQRQTDIVLGKPGARFLMGSLIIN